MTGTDHPATQLLSAHLSGDAGAVDRLLPLVYEDLRALAAGYMAQERLEHSLQPTALVNEAYLRLVRIDRMDWRGRAHFMAMAATAMRRVLVDHARARNAQKRGQGLQVETLDEGAAIAAEGSVDVLSVDVALEKLARVSERQARIVELRFFGGLTVEETAEVLGLSKDVVKSDWRFARAWLKRELGSQEPRP